MSEGWVGVDLDGTLAEYTGWKGHEHIGPPVPAMLQRVKVWLAQGMDVRIFTARVYLPEGDDVDPGEVNEAILAIRAWCKEHIGRPLPVTCCKDFGMIELWDDRCVQIIPNTGQRADGRSRGAQTAADRRAMAEGE